LVTGMAGLKVELWEGGGYVTIFLPRRLVEELIENGLVSEVDTPDGELYLLAEREDGIYVYVSPEED